jgi:hypothetical protein
MRKFRKKFVVEIVVVSEAAFGQSSNAFLLRFVVFDSFGKIYGFKFNDPGMLGRFHVTHEI